jgi:N-acetylmuramoyl-L-alanine amidase
MTKKIKYFISSLLMLASVNICNAASNNDFVVVIDAGHGGKDYGCIGNVANEKTITLDVAKRLADKIKAGCSDTKVVLTRDGDYFLTLQQRADVANKAHGDLFISIHVNSVDKSSKNRTSVSGASVYAVGADKERNTLNVAMRENSVIELEDNYNSVYRGFDPNSAESYIIFELSNNLHLNQSLNFASMAQKQLVSTAGRLDKGVKQAGFWVLWATSMPAVLVELDFICNPTQEAFLNSTEGRDKCATALYNAFRQYEAGMVRKSTISQTKKK